MHLNRLLPCLLLALLACVRNPVTGQQQLSLLSEQEELQLGQESSEQVRRQIGLVEAPTLQARVAEVGHQVAAVSERPALPWSFQVVDDASVNAFALPGGPIFITRGMAAHLNSEAELASVLGHEVGHITARHAAAQVTRQQLTQVGLGLGTVLAPDLAQYAGLASTGLQVLFLKYGRDQERQSDELGLRYTVAAGYDASAMVDLFQMLEGIGQKQQGQLPEWLSTHPSPENRLEATRERLAALKLDPSQLRRGRDEYLRLLEGLPYGVDPRQGYFEDNHFYHPASRLQLQLPAGWKAENRADAVLAVSPPQDAVVGLASAGTLSPTEALQRFLTGEGLRPLPREGAPLPANAAWFEASTQQGVVRGLVAFTSLEGATWKLLGYTPAERLDSYQDTFRATLASFGPLTDSARLQAQPARLHLVTTEAPTTLEAFHAAHPGPLSLQELALINGLQPSAPLPRGYTLKTVRTGARP